MEEIVQPQTRFGLFKNKIPYLFIALFSVLLAIGMFYHEMWRDELDIYGRIALNGTLKYSQYDYSYLTYNFLIKVFLWFNNSQTSYQICHYSIIVAVIFLLNKYAPFTLFEKAGITFSYFLFFEYGVISRYYGFLVLMVFIIMYLLSRKKVNYYLLIIPLIILANHSINSFIFALALFVVVLNNLFKEKENNNLTRKTVVAYIGVFLFFVLMGILYITYTTKLKSAFEGLAEAPYFMSIRTIWNSFLPLPEFTSHANFWNTNLFEFPLFYQNPYDVAIYKTTQNFVLAGISVLIFLIVLIKFSKKPLVFFVFMGNYILVLLFLHSARFYFIRHQGLLFIVFLYSYWLYHIADERMYLPVIKNIKLTWLNRIKIDYVFKPMLTLFLIIQMVSSGYAFYKDVKFKYTMSYDAADYIKQNNLVNDYEMVGFVDYAAQTIAINLKKQMFFPQSGQKEYVWQPFESTYKRDIPLNEVFYACSNYTEQQNKKVLLVLNFPLSDSNQQPISAAMLSPKTSVTFLKAFTGDVIQEDEQFWIYECKHIIP